MIILYWDDYQLSSRRIRSNIYEQICRSGDVRAILTPPSDVTIVKVYEHHFQREEMVPGDVYIGLAYPFDGRANPYNSVRDYTFFMDDSLQTLAFEALIRPRAAASRMTTITRRYMRQQGTQPS
jgi:hypothetical protein